MRDSDRKPGNPRSAGKDPSPKESGVSLGLTVANFRSYYGDETSFRIWKPITLIAGPNGEGKTNLLDAILLASAGFIERSDTLRQRSLFRAVIPSPGPSSISETELEDGGTTLQRSVLGSSGLFSVKDGVNRKARYQPSNFISHGKADFRLDLRLHDEGMEEPRLALGRHMMKATRRRDDFTSSGFENILENLDLFYACQDDSILNPATRLIGRQLTELVSGVRGQQAKGTYLRSLLSSVDSENRLITDVDSGTFGEAYSDPAAFFLEELPTGAKRELLVYLLTLMKERNRDRRRWLGLILIDEFEGGLHLDRLRQLSQSLLDLVHQDEFLRTHIRIVLTTHSPVVYSLFASREDCVTTWVLRKRREPSKLATLGEADSSIGDRLLLEHLGMSILDLPRATVFVEGPTDAAFYRGVLEGKDFRVVPMFGANIPNVLSGLLALIPLARMKRYILIRDSVEASNRGAFPPGIDAVTIASPYPSLERMLFGVEDGDQPSIQWDKTREGLERISRLAAASDVPLRLPNVDAGRRNMSKEADTGVDVFLKILKATQYREMYSFVGRRWGEALPSRVQAKLKAMLAQGDMTS